MTARKTNLIKGRVDHIAEELDRCRAAYRKLEAALEECLEYFAERQDGEYVDGRPVGNAEMRLGQMVEEALGRGGRYG
jgi:hypothetical protein